MTDYRTDHAAKAREALSAAQMHPADADVIVDPWLLTAQVHATLALVEQQRIANVISIAHWVSNEHLAKKLDDLRMGVAGEVWEGLGLT